MKALFYIELGAREQTTFGHPFGSLPTGCECYDLDNHADATTIHYARRLLDQADEVVLVFKQLGDYDSLGQLTGFLEGLLRNKAVDSVTYMLGEVDLPPLLTKKLFSKKVSQDELLAIAKTL